MLMKIDGNMESGGSSGEEVTSPPSQGSLSPMALQLSSRSHKGGPYSPPLDRNSPMVAPSASSLSAQHMISSMAVSSAAVKTAMNPGILASLSALNAMSNAAAAASYHHHHHHGHPHPHHPDFGGGNSSFVNDRGLDRHPYGSPPAPVVPTNDPSANECKLVDYRGQKVAAFVINGETMLCLPQAFELFLKHLVGGLHTVYTKLKRLDIVPLVCNVEQVRILRGLGAIQPGVNRCKLLSDKDFDILYKDCTTASSRPGRPPKRTSVPLVPLTSHGAPSQFMTMKKTRLENGDYPSFDSSPHNPSDVMRMEKSPLLANGYNHPPTQIPPMHLLPLAGQSAAAAAAVAAHAALFSPSGLPLPPGQPRDCRTTPMQSIDPRSAATWESCRNAYEEFVKQFESRYQEECSDSEKSSHHANEGGSGGDGCIRNGNIEGSSPALNLSKPTPQNASDSEENAEEEDEDFSDNEKSDGNSRNEKKFCQRGSYEERINCSGDTEGSQRNVKNQEEQEDPRSHSPQPSDHVPNNADTHPSDADAAQFANLSATTEAAISSTENLLRNIQGLLKVAADNAKQQERRINLEKAEFKMEILRERELRERLEKQLVEERSLRNYYERRWKKERRFRKRLEIGSSSRAEDSNNVPSSGGRSSSSNSSGSTNGRNQCSEPLHLPSHLHQHLNSAYSAGHLVSNNNGGNNSVTNHHHHHHSHNQKERSSSPSVKQGSASPLDYGQILAPSITTNGEAIDMYTNSSNGNNGSSKNATSGMLSLLSNNLNNCSRADSPNNNNNCNANNNNANSNNPPNHNNNSSNNNSNNNSNTNNNNNNLTPNGSLLLKGEASVDR